MSGQCGGQFAFFFFFKSLLSIKIVVVVVVVSLLLALFVQSKCIGCGERRKEAKATLAFASKRAQLTQHCVDTHTHTAKQRSIS